MAETEISNVGGDGVASEVTLQRLVQATEAMAKKAGIDSKGAAAKLQALYNKEVNTSVGAIGDQTTATEEQTGATKEVTQETNKFSRAMGNFVSTGLGALFRSSIELGKSLFENKTGVQAFTDNLPGIGGILAPFAKYADESLESFRGLSQVGASFGGSLEDMRRQAAGMEMSLSTMSDLFRNQAGALSALGGTVTEGAIRFGKMNKNLKATGDFDSLMRMGFTMEEVNEGMGDYITNQARMGRLQGQSTAQLAAGSADYLMQIDKLAKVTGKTRDQAQAALDSQAADSVARTLLNQFEKGSDEYKNLQMSLALLDEVGGSTAEALKGMLTGSPTEAAGQLLAVLGDAGPSIADAMAKIGQGADPQVLLDAFGAAGGELETFANSSATERARIIQEMKAAGNPMADFLDNATVMLDLSKRDLAAASKEQAATTKLKEDAAADLVAFENQQRAVSAAMHEVFVESDLLGKMGRALDAVVPLFESLATGLGTFADNLSAEGMMFALTEVAKSGIKMLWENPGIIGAIVGGIALMFGGKLIAGAMLGGIKKAIGSLMGGGGDATGSKKGGKAGATAGKGLATMGKGLGKGLGGVLRGLAGGIAAFANPAVALGAAVLAGTIVVVGGAIAGAIWMVGSALPTFAEGMKTFENLDGKKLIDAGKGMLAVGGGMAAFGAGSAIGAAGNAIANLISLLPGKSPLEKIEEFGNKKLNTVQIKTNAEAMSAYGKAMADMPSGPAPSVLTAFKTGLVAFLGGETDPFAPMEKFGNRTFNTTGIIANAGAVAAYAVAMKDFPIVPGASVFTAAGDAIVAMLGGKIDPFAPMESFGNRTFNAAGLTTNAKAVSSFASAMKEMPEVDVKRSGGVLGAIAGWFAGDTVMPWDSVKAFGDADISAAGVKANAEAINAMSTSLNTFSLEKLDSQGIISYTSAMEDLVKVLEKMNDELTKDNSWNPFSKGENAGSALAAGGGLPSTGGGSGSDQLNTTMQRVEQLLTEIKGFEEKTANNTKNISSSNIANGGVSNG